LSSHTLTVSDVTFTQVSDQTFDCVNVHVNRVQYDGAMSTIIVVVVDVIVVVAAAAVVVAVVVVVVVDGGIISPV